MSIILLWFTKLILFFSKTLRLGAGSTWPGHIMLSVNPSSLREFNKKFKGKIIVIAGTNGKTTTSKMIRNILEADGKRVIHNEAGANLLNGVASAIIDSTDWLGRIICDTAILEVDENTLPLLVSEITPDILVILNLFRDQLDRYGEVNTIALRWQNALKLLPKDTRIILNADDPQVAFLREELSQKVSCFGIEDESLYLSSRPHAMDASFCPNCGKRLNFEGIYFSHLGKWTCKSCGLKRPTSSFTKIKSTLPGIYNLYNTQAAILVAKTLGAAQRTIEKSLADFVPAFGRQESFKIDGKTVTIFLSKNPAGFNESIRTVKELGGKNFLLVLNDRIPDGRDVSWIWDVDTEELTENTRSIVVSGERVYDIALRLKYSSSSEFPISPANCGIPLRRDNFKFQIEEDLKKAIALALKQTFKTETLYILPTYSAMLEVRKILTGRKIL